MLYVHGYTASGPGALEKVRLETVVHFNSNGHVPVTCGVPMRCPHTALILPFLLPHALRSPLRVLSLHNDIIEERTESDNTLTEYLVIVVSAVHNLWLFVFI